MLTQGSMKGWESPCQFGVDSKIRWMTEIMHTQVLLQNMAGKAGPKVLDAPKGKVQWRRLVRNVTKKLKVGKAAKAYWEKDLYEPALQLFQYFIEYITGMSLKAETYPCRASLARTRAIADVNSRHCNLTVETMGHISGK